MRILHVIAQKPYSTGSGVYLTGLIEGFSLMTGEYEQALIAGLPRSEILPPKEKEIFRNIQFFPLWYETESLNFKILGMSDVMPYESTRYKDVTPEMLTQFTKAFTTLVTEVLSSFKPDIIISHHLYLTTALLRPLVSANCTLVGVCHGTCLRQLHNHPLAKELIIKNISELDSLLVLHGEQKKQVLDIFSVSEKKVMVIGSGYNSTIFYNKKKKKSKNLIKIVFTGKMSRGKGVHSLLKAVELIAHKESLPPIEVSLIGSGTDSEFHAINEVIKNCSYPVHVLGRIDDQKRIAEIYSSSHVFVLASFFEGLPLVIIEAMACGLEVVTTDIPGVQSWLKESLEDLSLIDFVPLPRLRTIDEPYEEDLPLFERQLADAIKVKVKKSIQNSEASMSLSKDIEKISWKGLCERLMSFFSQKK